MNFLQFPLSENTTGVPTIKQNSSMEGTATVLEYQPMAVTPIYT
jgi:hypothetical protein